MKTIQRRTIAPEEAKTILAKCNTHNRQMSQYHVDFLASEMKHGRFKDNGDAIRFDVNGNLIDGQHRLAACVKSGVPLVDVIVVLGLDPDAIDTIDSGKKRSASDKVHLRGYARSKNLAAVARMRLAYFNGDISATHKYSDLEILKTIEEKKDVLAEAVSMADKIYNSPLKVMPSVMAAVISLSLEYSREKTVEIVDKIASGEDLAAGDPCLMFRKTIAKHVGKWDRRAFFNIAASGFNAMFSGKKTRKLFASGVNTTLFFAPVFVGCFASNAVE